MSTARNLSVLLLLTTIIITAISTTTLSEEPFFRNANYDPAISAPDEIIGFPLGERPVRYHEAVAYFKYLDEASDRFILFESGETHEGRTLYYAITGSAGNLSKLDEIKSDHQALADPRKTNAAEAKRIIQSTPAIAWMMYSIHGDELSGADASLQLAYQMTAGEDSLTKRIRNTILVAIDPMENPDGRERWIGQMQQLNGKVLNPDLQSMQHGGNWPWGRTNHYLFDLNRDWFIMSQPETVARITAINEWHPQVVVDAHEMGSYSSFLFPPAREPFNPNYPPLTHKWADIFAADHAAAFDEYGWSYYTGEWLEEWYPGYGSSNPFLRGALAILYEQASTDGTPVRRPDGNILTFRSAVHHQFVSSIANIKSLADNDQAMLEMTYQIKKDAINNTFNDPYSAYIINPGENESRARRLVKRLMMQGIEVHQATRGITVAGAESYWDRKPARKSFDAGTYVVKMNQPLRPLIKAILEYDPRMTTKFLQDERESLEKGEGTLLYEVSSWSMLIAYGVDAYRSTELPSSGLELLDALPPQEAHLVNPEPDYGYLIDYRDDKTVKFLFRLLDDGIVVRSAAKPFKVENKEWPRGTLLIRNIENEPGLASDLAKLSAEYSVSIQGVNTALAQDGPDLGGGEFDLLERPRIAMAAGASISTYNTGAMWYLLDYELQQRVSLLNSTQLRSADLRKYNVLILPSSGQYHALLGKRGKENIQDWVSDGGTLICIRNAAAWLADSSSGMSSVRLRRKVLNELDKYHQDFVKESQIGSARIDSAAFWSGNGGVKIPAATELDLPKLEELKRQDAFERTFLPRGAILSVELNPEHWLGFGAGERVPAIYYSPNAYMAKRPVEIVGRLSQGKDLRLSGLLWPEARERWQNTIYMTRERSGNGQIIMIMGEPNFRSYFYGTARLFLNAIVLGPGLGANQAVEW